MLTNYNIRIALNGLLENIIEVEEELDLGYCVARRSTKNDNLVIITKSSHRRPQSCQQLRKYALWNRGNSETPEEYSGSKQVLWPLWRYGYYGYSIRSNKSNPKRALAYDLVANAFIKAMFDPGEEIDVNSKSLPEEDMICHVGDYRLLYDHLAKEWRVWRKKN